MCLVWDLVEVDLVIFIWSAHVLVRLSLGSILQLDSWGLGFTAIWDFECSEPSLDSWCFFGWCSVCSANFEWSWCGWISLKLLMKPTLARRMPTASCTPYLTGKCWRFCCLVLYEWQDQGNSVCVLQFYPYLLDENDHLCISLVSASSIGLYFSLYR